MLMHTYCNGNRSFTGQNKSKCLIRAGNGQHTASESPRRWSRVRSQHPGAVWPRDPGAGDLATCGMETLGRGPGSRRDAVDIRYHVHYRRLAGGYGFVEGALNLAGMVHANAKATHVLSQLGKVSVRKHPQLLHVARLAAIVALVAVLFLVQRVVVVDDGHGVDAVPHRRLQFPEVVPEAAVASEAHH